MSGLRNHPASATGSPFGAPSRRLWSVTAAAGLGRGQDARGTAARCPARPSAGRYGSGGIAPGGRRAGARPAGDVRPRQRLPRAGGPQDWPGRAWSPLTAAIVAEVLVVGELVALTVRVAGGVQAGRSVGPAASRRADRSGSVAGEASGIEARRGGPRRRSPARRPSPSAIADASAAGTTPRLSISVLRSCPGPGSSTVNWTASS